MTQSFPTRTHHRSGHVCSLHNLCVSSKTYIKVSDVSVTFLCDLTNPMFSTSWRKKLNKQESCTPASVMRGEERQKHRKGRKIFLTHKVATIQTCHRARWRIKRFGTIIFNFRFKCVWVDARRYEFRSPAYLCSSYDSSVTCQRNHITVLCDEIIQISNSKKCVSHFCIRTQTWKETRDDRFVGKTYVQRYETWKLSPA